MEFTSPQTCASCRKEHLGYGLDTYRLDGTGVLWVRCACGHDIPIKMSEILIEDGGRSIARSCGIKDSPKGPEGL